jgi:hypothetical protein
MSLKSGATITGGNISKIDPRFGTQGEAFADLTPEDRFLFGTTTFGSPTEIGKTAIGLQSTPELKAKIAEQNRQAMIRARELQAMKNLGFKIDPRLELAGAGSGAVKKIIAPILRGGARLTLPEVLTFVPTTDTGVFNNLDARVSRWTPQQRLQYVLPQRNGQSRYAQYLNSGGLAIPSLSQTLERYSRFRQRGGALPPEWQGVTNLPQGSIASSSSGDTSGVPADAPPLPEDDEPIQANNFSKQIINALVRKILSKANTGKVATAEEREALKNSQEFKDFLDNNKDTPPTDLADKWKTRAPAEQKQEPEKTEPVPEPVPEPPKESDKIRPSAPQPPVEVVSDKPPPDKPPSDKPPSEIPTPENPGTRITETPVRPKPVQTGTETEDPENKKKPPIPIPIPPRKKGDPPKDGEPPEDTPQQKSAPNGTSDQFQHNDQNTLRPEFEIGGQDILMITEKERLQEIEDWDMFDLVIPEGQDLTNPLYNLENKQEYFRFNGFTGNYLNKSAPKKLYVKTPRHFKINNKIATLQERPMIGLAPTSDFRNPFTGKKDRGRFNPLQDPYKTALPEILDMKERSNLIPDFTNQLKQPDKPLISNLLPRKSVLGQP